MKQKILLNKTLYNQKLSKDKYYDLINIFESFFDKSKKINIENMKSKDFFENLKAIFYKMKPYMLRFLIRNKSSTHII